MCVWGEGGGQSDQRLRHLASVVGVGGQLVLGKRQRGIRTDGLPVERRRDLQRDCLQRLLARVADGKPGLCS